MKKSKLLVALLAAVALLASLAACSVTEVEAIRFINAPDATYNQGQIESASKFELEITYSNDNHRTVSLTDSILAVSGLVNGNLDTSTPGEKTIVVTYRGVSITVYYTVVGTGGSTITPSGQLNGEGTSDSPYEIGKPADLAAVGTVKSAEGTTYYKLTKDIDLSGNEWKALTASDIVLDGTNGEGTYTISNLRITAGSTQNDFGLFARLTNGTISNITFTDAYIDMTSTISGESCKNISAVVAYSTGSTVEKVTVDGAYLRGNGRVAGIIGGSYGTDTVTNCVVKNTRIVANNPVSVAEADGEGDKVGGIVGQNQGTVTITNCTVENTILSATRDVGGIVGWTTGATLEDNAVNGCTITASVPGGVREDVGTRNVGGIVGTVSAGTITWKNNTVDENTTYTTNSLYEESSAGKYIGGIRRGDRTKETILTDGTTSLKIEVYEGTADGEVSAFEDFIRWQTQKITVINEWIVNLSAEA